MATLQDVLNTAKTLSREDQIRLAQELIEQPLAEDAPFPSPEVIQLAQERSAAYDAGLLTASPWEEVKMRARAELL